MAAHGQLSEFDGRLQPKAHDPNLGRLARPRESLKVRPLGFRAHRFG